MEESKKRSKKWFILCIFLLFFVAAATACFLYFRNHQAEQDETMPQEGMRPEESGYISASGVTMIGMELETFDVETTDAKLEIEEVYVSSGDEVEQDSAILKFTEESVQEVQSELSHAAAEAALNYRQGLIEYQAALIEAKKTYETALLTGEYAQTAYEINLAQAQEELDSLTQEAEDARELYEEYYDGIYNQGYEKEYELAEKKELYETNEALYRATLKRWNIDDKEINNSSGGQGASENAPMSGGALTAGGMGGASQSDSSQIEALELLEDTYRAEKEEYEQALEDCQKAVDTAKAGIEQAKAAYDRLCLELEEANIDYEKKAASCLADRESQTLSAATAKADYQTEQKRQEEALAVLEDEKNETEDNLALFEESVRDGCLYTKNRGTIVAVAVSEGNTLSKDAMVVAYSNPDVITVSASVQQKDIAGVSVGDTAVVVTEDYGNLEGVVTQINPVSNSQGRASVTYPVEISIEPGEQQIEANKTVTVYFGISLSEMGGGRS